MNWESPFLANQKIGMSEVFFHNTHASLRVANSKFGRLKNGFVESDFRCNAYISTYIWLVVWNMNFIFPYIGNKNPN
jgi:hypothetical protein